MAVLPKLLAREKCFMGYSPAEQNWEWGFWKNDPDPDTNHAHCSGCKVSCGRGAPSREGLKKSFHILEPMF